MMSPVVEPLAAVLNPPIMVKTAYNSKFENMQIDEKGDEIPPVPDKKIGQKDGRQYIQFDDETPSSWSGEDVVNTARYVKKSVVRVFAADGGGGRGKFTTTLMARLEQELGPDVKLGNVFDVWGGTSVGAILALGCLKPSPKDPLQPEFSAREMDAKFPELIGKIFPYTWWSRTCQMFNVMRNYAEYNKDGLIDAVEVLFHETKLKDALKDFVIPTYHPSKEKTTWYLTRQLAVENLFFRDITMKKTLLMATAAPTFFEPEIYKGKRFLDGGLFANDPAEAAWITARNKFGPTSKYTIVSFGTGTSPTKLDTDPTSSVGIYSIGGEIVDLLMNASEEATNQNMQDRFHKGYYRLQKNLKKPIALNDSRPVTMAELTEEANALLDEPKVHDRWEVMVHDLRKAENTEPYAQPLEL